MLWDLWDICEFLGYSRSQGVQAVEIWDIWDALGRELELNPWNLGMENPAGVGLELPLDPLDPGFWGIPGAWNSWNPPGLGKEAELFQDLFLEFFFGD